MMDTIFANFGGCQEWVQAGWLRLNSPACHVGTKVELRWKPAIRVDIRPVFLSVVGGGRLQTERDIRPELL